jgi:2-polyprenyl-3-methyl-5-hydroxy-6-metoxy-1,4-benzoquinol methylase
MTTKGEWERFFDGHAPQYMDNPFTGNTVEEVTFLLDEFKLPPGSWILDVGCGTGRHAVELAKRGYQITGVDISAGMLAQAQETAAETGVTIEWMQADATQFSTTRPYDAAICLCEGAFGLLNTGEAPGDHDLRILRRTRAALQPGGRLVLTTLNGLAKIRRCTQADVQSGRFDPLTMIELLTVESQTERGQEEVTLAERGYLPQELIRLFGEAGLEVEHIWGGTAGNWGHRQIDLDEMEIMVVARKPVDAR